MNLKGNLTSKGLQGSIGKSRMQGILGTNPAAIPITVDNALSLSSTNPVQNKVITAAITNRLWSDEVKDALLQIVEKVAYIDADGQDYYDALYDALYPPVGLDSIGAVFDSSATIYNTDTLDDLKQYLNVTAFYSDGTSETVTTYTLSGSMDAGTQTITVSYGDKTTTFTVTVVEWLVSIDAVFAQGSATIYDTDSLDTLRQYLTVTATYSDSTTATVTDYTLSGTLAEGTSVVTVTYGGKTDTFSVTVTHETESVLHDWDFTQSLTDSVGGITAVTSKYSSASALVRDSNGLNFSSYGQCVNLGAVYDRDICIDIEMSDVTLYTGSSSSHTRFVMYGNTNTTGTGILIYRANNGWTSYIGSTWGSTMSGLSSRSYFNGTNVKVTLKIGTDGTVKVYKDDVLVGTENLKAPAKDTTNKNIYIGSATQASAGAQFYSAKVKRIKIYKEYE